MNTPLPPALHGERFEFDGISCYVAGKGPPLLLVHSVNAAASAAEVRPLFDHYRDTHTVFAPDLPGYGHSERGERDYTPRLMTDALHATVQQIRRWCGSQPVDALGASLGCEFLARAAVEDPQAFGRIALVSPTGLNGRRAWRKPEGRTREIPGMHAVLRQKLWAQWLFDQLTRPGVVRYFLQRTFGRQEIDETMWAYAVQTARQPGARHAPLQFLSAKLFSADIHRVYEAIPQPVWLSHGTRGDFTDFRALGQLHFQSPWQQTVFETGALPYFEKPGQFAAVMDTFLREQIPVRPATSLPRHTGMGSTVRIEPALR
jgi:pimeloyl-ACP methyl ester carboxylesterase